MIKATVKGDKMFIEADLNNFKRSGSGKNDVVTTGGIIPVQDTPYKIGLNIMRPTEKE